MFNKTLELISETHSKDAIGQMKKKTETYRKVFADTKPIPQSEFFEAGQTKIKPAICFKIRQCEYKNEKRIRYNDQIFEVYRTYPTKNEMIELWCEVRTGGK